MSVRAFKAFGVLTISLDLLMFGSGLGQTLLRLHSDTSELFRTVLVFFVLLIIGSGLLYLRKWAALYFSLPLFCIGVLMAWSSIETIPFPLNLVWMCEGVSLMLPALVTVRMWSELVWQGKWFF